MRVTKNKNGLTVKGYAGTTGILLAMNLDDDPPQDFLGFALQRVGTTGKKEWLCGMLPFPHMPHDAGTLLPTNEAPIQKFRWSDYTVNPNTLYEYTVHLVSGDPKRPKVEEGPTVRLTTLNDEAGTHRILFNRAAAASQAFARKFPTLNQKLTQTKKGHKTDVPITSDAMVWLSRGVKESIVQFIERAKDKNWALDVAIYQYELSDIVDAVNAAHERGVDVRVVFHAKPKDSQTTKNEKNLRELPAACKHARRTSRIFHHKFIVVSRLVDGRRQPEAVLCGSTNFTHNGVYRQANFIHSVDDKEVAGQYLNLFEELFTSKSPSDTKTFINKTDPIRDGQPLYVGFSPRSGLGDLADFVKRIDAAQRDVLFCTAFNLYADVQKALLGKPHDPILRYGVQDKKSTITGYHADRTADFEATALLPSGIEGFLKESLQGDGGSGRILIHTKLIVVDFTSDAPTVICGSHNFSRPASEGNDENFLIIHGDTDVADAYGCELMRLYDHYRFRFWAEAQAAARKKGTNKADLPLTLKTDSSWTKGYYRPNSLQWSDRILFAGGTLSQTHAKAAPSAVRRLRASDR